MAQCEYCKKLVDVNKEFALSNKLCRRHNKYVELVNVYNVTVAKFINQTGTDKVIQGNCEFFQQKNPEIVDFAINLRKQLKEQVNMMYGKTELAPNYTFEEKIKIKKIVNVLIKMRSLLGDILHD